MPRCFTIFTVLSVVLSPVAATAEQAIVAVATNFAEVAGELESRFEDIKEHELTITTGSTGKLYAQIMQGAPFDVLLAADQERPERLEHSGDAIDGTRFTYATGQLVLWSPDTRRISDDGQEALQPDRFTSLAIANPRLAPYGAAARQALQNLGLWATLKSKIVLGENIGQTFGYVATRNAELGFVALSQVKKPGNGPPGSFWEVPTMLHEPILQDAVLLRHGKNNSAAIEFLDFLRSGSARAVIEASGYRVE